MDLAVDVQAHLPFLSREETYKRQKPYGADFPVDDIDGACMTNHVFDVQSIKVHDVRGGNDLTLERNGSCFIKGSTSLAAKDATVNHNKAMDNFIVQILSILQERFPQYTEIRHMDHQARTLRQPWKISPFSNDIHLTPKFAGSQKISRLSPWARKIC